MDCESSMDHLKMYRGLLEGEFSAIGSDRRVIPVGDVICLISEVPPPPHRTQWSSRSALKLLTRYHGHHTSYSSPGSRTWLQRTLARMRLGNGLKESLHDGVRMGRISANSDRCNLSPVSRAWESPSVYPRWCVLLIGSVSPIWPVLVGLHLASMEFADKLHRAGSGGRGHLEIQ